MIDGHISNVSQFFQIPLIKERVTLSSISSDLWTTEHDDTILKFLKDPTLRVLVVYMDKLLGLQVSTSIPPHQVEELTYMIRSDAAILTAENLEKKLQFGTVHMNYVEGLLRLMSNLYGPLFFGKMNWPDSILNYAIYHNTE